MSPGANGLFDGVAPTGDDQVTNFDTFLKVSPIRREWPTPPRQEPSS